MNRSSMLLCLIAAAVSLAACSPSKERVDKSAVAEPGATPDLSGVWQLSTPVQALRTVDGKVPPLRPEAQKLYDDRLAATARGDRSWDNTLKCKPPGEPRTLIENGWPFQIGQSDDRVVFMFQWNRLVRVIEMNKQLPEYDGPFFFGRTSGSWDGDALVATVIGVREQVSLDSTGLPHSEDMKLTERFRLIDGGSRLEARIRVEDPATYTDAWETVLTFSRQPEDSIVEDNCLDRVKPENYYRPSMFAES